MRFVVALTLVLLLCASAIAYHDDGKGPRSLGGRTVERTPEWLRLEAESFETKEVGALEPWPGATGGTAWNLSSYGSITTTIDVPNTGVVWVDIRARGWHPADMRNPHMHIRVDGIQRAEWDVRGDLIAYAQSVPMLAGKHTISVDNFNNYRADVADRPLTVDWIVFSTPTLVGSPHVPAGGYTIVDAADIHDSVTGQLQTSTLARNQTQWLQWGVGCFAEMVVFEGTGHASLTPRLKGDVVNGIGTRVQIMVDGKQIDQYFETTDWTEKTTAFDVAASGPHLLEICYDNDEGGAKRTLTLDEFAIALDGSGSVAPPPAPSEAWTRAHATLDNHRHVASGIDATSVRTARQAWSYKAGTVTGTPAVSNGVAYFGDYAGKLHAVKVSDGSLVWSVDNGAGVDSSVALDDKNVYVGDQDGWLSARSRADGSLVWRVAAGEVDGTHLYGSPVVVDGVLYTGVASEQTLIEYTGPQTFRGSVAAFDLQDGHLLWRTYTQAEGGKGVSVWSTPAIDPALGLLFVGTGNSYGTPVSQYTDSILALKLSDGSIAWSYQATKNDAFDARGGAGPDRDFGASPLLFDANGKKLVGDGDKGGNFYALERATGSLVWSAKADFKVDGVASSQLEGFLGTASYHEGTIFAPTTARSMVHAIDASTGQIKWATELNALPQKYGDRMFGPSTAAENVVLQGNSFGHVFALDMATGKVLADLPVGGSVQGGIALAGDTFLVPHVGKDLWSATGGIVAFRVDASAPPAPTPTTPVTTPSGTPTTGTPHVTADVTPTENVDGEGTIGREIPGVGLVGLLGILATIVSVRRARRG